VYLAELYTAPVSFTGRTRLHYVVNARGRAAALERVSSSVLKYYARRIITTISRRRSIRNRIRGEGRRIKSRLVRTYITYTHARARDENRCESSWRNKSFYILYAYVCVCIYEKYISIYKNISGGGDVLTGTVVSARFVARRQWWNRTSAITARDAYYYGRARGPSGYGKRTPPRPSTRNNKNARIGIDWRVTPVARYTRSRIYVRCRVSKSRRN